MADLTVRWGSGNRVNHIYASTDRARVWLDLHAPNHLRFRFGITTQGVLETDEVAEKARRDGLEVEHYHSENYLPEKSSTPDLFVKRAGHSGNRDDVSRMFWTFPFTRAGREWIEHWVIDHPEVERWGVPEELGLIVPGLDQIENVIDHARKAGLTVFDYLD